MKRYLARAKKQELSTKPKLSIASETGLMAMTPNRIEKLESKFEQELLSTLARMLIIHWTTEDEAKSLWEIPTDAAGRTGTNNHRSQLARQTLRAAHYSGRILYAKEESPGIARITAEDLNTFLAKHRLPPLNTSRKVSYSVGALMQELSEFYDYAPVYNSKYSALR